MDKGSGYGDKAAKAGVEGAGSGGRRGGSGVEGGGDRGGGIGGGESAKIGAGNCFFFIENL